MKKREVEERQFLCVRIKERNTYYYFSIELQHDLLGLTGSCQGDTFT